MFSSNFSNLSEGVNHAFIFILSIIFVFLIGLTAVMIYFIFRYRESKNPVATQIHGNNKLEIIWTIIPLILVMAMFYYGWVAYKPMESAPPANAMNIETVARMWKWSFKYENGKQTDTLIIPQSKAISLNLKSVDVIHSFYIPAFRVKKDVVPGTDRNLWFVANTPGLYDLFCTEFCGLNHSGMITSVKVLTQTDFDKWYGDTATLLAKVPGGKVEPAGKTIMDRIGCFACHSVDGTKIVGPSYLSLFGKEELVISNGNEHTIKVDEAYIKHSIIDPNADVVKGFNSGLMQSYKDQLSAQEIDQIIEYLKTLN